LRAARRIASWTAPNSGGHSRGAPLLKMGDPDRGIALAIQALAAMRAIQSRHFLCYLLGLLADA